MITNLEIQNCFSNGEDVSVIDDQLTIPPFSNIVYQNPS
jgi:hypothetical protein